MNRINVVMTSMEGIYVILLSTCFTRAKINSLYWILEYRYLTRIEFCIVWMLLILFQSVVCRTTYEASGCM